MALAASPKLTPGRFLQLHGCVWTSSQGAFLTLEEWRALEVDARLAPGDEVMLGFRGGEAWALVACRRGDGVLFTLAGADPLEDMAPARELAGEAMAWAIDTYQVAAVFATTSAEYKTLADGWRHELGRKRVLDVDVARPGPRTSQIVERFAADARNGHVHHDGDRRLAAAIAAARLAQARGHTYLVVDARRDVAIAGALAALLAWEARAVLGADSDTKQPGRAVWT